MSQCSGTTQSGHRCKNRAGCHIHGEPSGPECSICLVATGKTRSTKELRCGHKFHKACIDEWTRKGGEQVSCPMCRKSINPNKYKVTVYIENLETKTSNILLLNEISTLTLFNGLNVQSFPGPVEIEMMMEHDRTLLDFLSDLNMSLADVNSLIFNTERTPVN